LPTRQISSSSFCLMSCSCIGWNFSCIVCTSFSHKVQRNLLNFKSWLICYKQKATNSSEMWRLVGFPCYLQAGILKIPSSHGQNACRESTKWCCKEELKFFEWCGSNFKATLHSSITLVCSCLD
jgi:hypothetical protein